MDQEFSELLTGCLLGDGSLSKNYGYNCRFSEEHGINQKDYLLWKADKFNGLYGRFYERKRPRPIKENNKIYRSNTIDTICCFNSSCHNFFTNLEKKWYLRDNNSNYILDEFGNRIKCLPDDLHINPFSLMIWFLDDGHNCVKKTGRRRRTITLATHKFSSIEHNRLISLLKEKFNINSRIYAKEIVITGQSYVDFLTIIKSQSHNLPACMQYKFDMSNCEHVLDYLRNTNKSGYSGMFFDLSNNKWRVALSVKGARIQMGRYKDKDVAIKVLSACKKMQKSREASIGKYIHIKNYYKESNKRG